MYGSRFRNMRSVDSVCHEMAAAVKAWPSIKTVTFHDEVFTANSRWLAEFADKWPTEVGLPFSIITHPELVKEETAVLLGRAGCAHVIMGTQTVNDQSRDMLARTETSEDVRRAVTSLRAQGIWTVVDHILGIPGEVDQDQDDALLFYSSIKPNVIKAFFLTYLPGTDINKEGLESGMWDLERLKAAERGHIDSWLFKGVGDIPEWRAYYQLFTLFTVVPPDLMHWAVEQEAPPCDEGPRPGVPAVAVPASAGGPVASWGRRRAAPELRELPPGALPLLDEAPLSGAAAAAQGGPHAPPTEQRDAELARGYGVACLVGPAARPTRCSPA